MPVLPFSTDAEVVQFARAFLKEHLARFCKDIKICLTANAKDEEAYFPAMITCIAFAEFLSRLYAGKLDDGDGHKKLKNYIAKFMPPEYTADCVDILYECFRHKVAHLALPYVVFDTSKSKTLHRQPRRLITWIVTAGRGRPPIQIAEVNPAKQIQSAVTPWAVYYDHIVTVYLCNLAHDIKSSVARYLRHLEADNAARDNFKKCMSVCFPR
jgi:hypothetical protein